MTPSCSRLQERSEFSNALKRNNLTLSAVHLLGNYIYQPGFEDSDDESDYDSHDDYSDLYDDDEELEEDEDIPVG